MLSSRFIIRCNKDLYFDFVTKGVQLHEIEVIRTESEVANTHDDQMSSSKREWGSCFKPQQDLDDGRIDPTPRKRLKASESVTSCLDSFLSVCEPFPLYKINESMENDSRFLALSHPISKPKQATDFHSFVKRKYPDASHVVLGWKVVCLKQGKTGIDGPDDFEQRQGFLDDGERWAGERVMYNTALDTACVVVRWFGGQLLGGRFEIFSGLAKEVCAFSSISEDLRALKFEIEAVDVEIAALQTGMPKSSALSTDAPSYISKSVTLPAIAKEITRCKRIKEAKSKKLEFLRVKASSTLGVEASSVKENISLTKTPPQLKDTYQLVEPPHLESR